jgi:uncharacterized protein YdhG (YjbR/CyaY superfamily)
MPSNKTISFQSIDEYHSTFPSPVRKLLDELRSIIQKTAPKAKETISYNMPTFKGIKNLVHYAGYKNHIGFYPTPSPINHYKDELKKFKFSKGAIQFPLDQKLPKALIQKMVRFRIQEDSKNLS